MSDIELAIKRCKRLETILEESLGASGRGLHQKVSSVENALPRPLVKRLRYIASVRNKLVHEPDSDQLDDRRDYEQACDQAERELHQLTQKKEKVVQSWDTSTGIVVATSTGTVVALVVILLALILLAAAGAMILILG
jgi:hypothetical protein